MRRLKLKELSFIHQVCWYVASLVFGFSVIAVAASSHAVDDATSFWFATLLFGSCWVIVVFLLRLYLQQIEDPTSLRSILGMGRRTRK